jgi:membrane fusion protein, multidrug efflux system
MASQEAAERVDVRPFPAMKRPHEDEAPETIVQTPAVAAPPPRKKRSARNIVLPVVLIAALGGGGWYGYDWWTTGRFMVSTDDAYVTAQIAAISPKVSGYVDSVKVVENQKVKAGDPLLVLDDGDYRIAADQADAAIATQRQTLKRIDAQIVAAQASLKQAQAQLTSAQAGVANAQLTRDRASKLLNTDVGSQATYDNAATALDQAKAALAGADAQVAAAEANIGVFQAQYNEAASQVRSLELARDKAERDLSFTVLKAPYDGVVGNLSVKKGDLVSPGMKLAALVPTHELYIEANFKETQLLHLVPGEKVRISVDSLGSQTFEGTVASLAPASGSVFSLLPADNATGNFTKVVQRVPVRIDIPQSVLDSDRLQAGLSAVVDVDTRTAPSKTAAN